MSSSAELTERMNALQCEMNALSLRRTGEHFRLSPRCRKLIARMIEDGAEMDMVLENLRAILLHHIRNYLVGVKLSKKYPN